MQERRVAYALLDLQQGLEEAAARHADDGQSPRTGALLALLHMRRFIEIALPSANMVPIDDLSTALAALDAGITEPLLETQTPARRATTPSQVELRALLSAAVTFLIDRTLPGERLDLPKGCEAIARISHRLGVRDVRGSYVTGRSIGVFRDELLSGRPVRGTATAEQLMRLSIKSRGLDRHSDYFHLLRRVQLVTDRPNRLAVVERVVRRFVDISPIRRT
jgi:hypothetical protein